DLESSVGDEIVDAAIEVAAASDALPHRIEPVLPPRDGDVRRVPMFDKEQTASRPQHAADFLHGASRVRDGTRRPGHDDVVDARLAHDEVGQAWKDVARVDAHALTRAARAPRGREPHRWTWQAGPLGSARAPSASRRSPG